MCGSVAMQPMQCLAVLPPGSRMQIFLRETVTAVEQMFSGNVGIFDIRGVISGVDEELFSTCCSIAGALPYMCVHGIDLWPMRRHALLRVCLP